MKKNFDDLTIDEKMDLVETYLKTKNQITGMDIATCFTLLGGAGSICLDSFTDAEFFKYVPFAMIPIFAFMAYKKVKLSKQYKKVTNGKVNYARIRKTDFNGQLAELTATYTVGEQARRVSENLSKLLGIDHTTKVEIDEKEEKVEIKDVENKEVKIEKKEEKVEEQENEKK